MANLGNGMIKLKDNRIGNDAMKPSLATSAAAPAVKELQDKLVNPDEALDSYLSRHSEAGNALREHTDAMAKIIATLSAKINAIDAHGKDNYYIPEAKSPLLNPAFLVPAFLLTSVLIAIIWLFSVAGVLKADTVYILTVVVACGLALQVLFSNIRNLQLHKRITGQSKVALKEELQLEHARAELFSGATKELQEHLFAITSAVPQGSNPTIDDATRRLMALLDRMSLISTLTTHGADYVLNTEKIELGSQLASLIAECRAQANATKVEVELHAPRKITCELDPLLIKQAIKPVLENAIKFSADSKGGGKVSVTLSGLREGFEVRVSDNGPGIAPARRQQLFKPFSRGEDALRFNYEGAGLGLYLASLATGLLGGSLAIVDSKVGAEFVWKFSGQAVVPDGARVESKKNAQPASRLTAPARARSVDSLASQVR